MSASKPEPAEEHPVLLGCFAFTVIPMVCSIAIAAAVWPVFVFYDDNPVLALVVLVAWVAVASRVYDGWDAVKAVRQEVTRARRALVETQEKIRELEDAPDWRKRDSDLEWHGGNLNRQIAKLAEAQLAEPQSLDQWFRVMLLRVPPPGDR